MEKKSKNKIILLFAVSMTVLCLIAGGCTSQTESTSDVMTTEDVVIEKPEITAEKMPPGEMSAEGMPAEGMGETGGAVRGGPDLTAAAETLGVTVEELEAALGDMDESGQVDLDTAAATLGITVEELEAALGPSGDMPPGAMPQGAPPA